MQPLEPFAQKTSINQLNLMKVPSACFLLLFIALIGGCVSTTPPPPDPGLVNWQTVLNDNLFSTKDIEIISTDTIFRLSPQLEEEIRSQLARQPSNEMKTQFLLNILFGENAKLGDVGRPYANMAEFIYDNQGTTIAEKTLINKRGNCISLSVLTYSLAQAYGLSPVVQEVSIPVQWERIANTDVINRHVNVRIRKPVQFSQNTLDFSRDLVIDFYPTNNGRRYSTKSLEQPEVIAMFYSNLGAEALLSNKIDLAYANIKSALYAFPELDAAWLNLAQVYLRKGESLLAVSALKQGLSYSPSHHLLLLSLLQQYEKSGNTRDALSIRERIIALQHNDPFFLIEKALTEKRMGNYKKAETLLENARDIAQGYFIIHNELADIYTILGKEKKANEQRQIAKSIAQREGDQPLNTNYWFEE